MASCSALGKGLLIQTPMATVSPIACPERIDLGFFHGQVHEQRPGRQDPYSFPQVDHRWPVQVDPFVMVFMVIPGDKGPDKFPGLIKVTEPVRELGWYFRVLNWLSEYGLPLETCGRLWVF